MVEISQDRPWLELEQLVESGDDEQLEAYLESLPSGDTALVVSRLSSAGQTQLLTTLTPDHAADVIGTLPDDEAVDLVADLSPETAAAIVEELPSDQQADLMGGLDHDTAAAILAEMPASTAEALTTLAGYPRDTAGGLMAAELLIFSERDTVATAIDDLRENADAYRDYAVQYAYVTAEDGALSGVLPLRDLLLSRPSQVLGDVMIRNPLAVPVTASLDELRDFFARHQFLGVPAVDSAGKLVGVVQRTAIEEALADQTASDYRRTQGIVREELRTMPVLMRSRRRLAWLSVNILLNVVAASVIAFYQETLAQVIALAVFLPIISDMSGCSGGQAVAVSMRELALGFVKPNEILRVWIKEILVGMVNGLALGVLIATVAWLWKGNPYLGLVVGSAMAVNTMVAVSIGGTLPLMIKRLGLDPALASGPILTTVTDMCGFFLILSLATWLLPFLIAA